MNIFTVLLDFATVILCISVMGCGAEQVSSVQPTPTPTVTIAIDDLPPIVTVAPTATPTATPTPNPTQVTYIFQAITLCTALKNWDPSTTTIKTYPTAGNTEIVFFLFRWDGVWRVTSDGESVANTTLTRSDIHGVVCTITVVNGQLTGVTP